MRPRYMIRTRSLDVPHDAQIVTDEKIRQVERRPQIHEQVQHLCLDRHVQRGDRFVADDEFRLDRQRARDTDARALTARELVRKAPHQRRVQADAIELQADVFDLLPLARSGRARPALRRRSSTTRRRGFSDAYGSWKIICILSCCWRASAGGWIRQALPAPAPSPLVGGSMPTAILPSVDLPQPDSPTNPTTSPFGDAQVDAIDRVHDFVMQARAQQIGDARRQVQRLDEVLGYTAKLQQRRRPGHQVDFDIDIHARDAATARSHIASKASSTARAKPAGSSSGEARSRSRSPARSVASRTRSVARSIAARTYSSGVRVISSVRSALRSRLAPLRENGRSPTMVDDRHAHPQRVAGRRTADAGQAVERDVGAQVTGEIRRDRSLADLLDALARDALTGEECQHPRALAVVRRCQQYQA